MGVRYEKLRSRIWRIKFEAVNRLATVGKIGKILPAHPFSAGADSAPRIQLPREPNRLPLFPGKLGGSLPLPPKTNAPRLAKIGGGVNALRGSGGGFTSI
jgi:hypothetical protein